MEIEVQLEIILHFNWVMSILTLKAYTEKAETKKTIFWYLLSKNIE